MSKILNANFFRMTNAIFFYGLTPDQFTVYSYLVSCAGSKDHCWPSTKTISACCHLSENTVRKAITALSDLHFIQKVQTTRYTRNGMPRRSNNRYYILDLPELPHSRT